MSMDRHFCVTVYVRHLETKQFLMIHHRKLNRWVPPGGHVDLHEIPDHAAIREVFEETGVKVRLQGRDNPTENCLTTPFGIQRNILKENEHEHLDLIYLGIPETSDQPLIENERESKGLGWFTVEEILSSNFSTFDSVKHWTNFFHKLLAE